jgi:hypothetical protein
VPDITNHSSLFSKDEEDEGKDFEDKIMKFKKNKLTFYKKDNLRIINSEKKILISVLTHIQGVVDPKFCFEDGQRTRHFDRVGDDQLLR